MISARRAFRNSETEESVRTIEALLSQEAAFSQTSPFRGEIGFIELKEACLWSGLAVGEGRQTGLFETAQEEDLSFEAS